MKSKEYARGDFINVIKSSWTWGRMTEPEREHFLKMFNKTEKAIGNYHQRIEYYNAIYTAFLYGLGYSGFNWREPGTIEAQ